MLVHMIFDILEHTDLVILAYLGVMWVLQAVGVGGCLDNLGDL